MANLLDEASILLTPTAYNNGSMLAVKPTNGDGDFTFSRNSSATRVNAQGLVENVQILSSNLVSNGDFSQEGSQLITNGDFATDSDWVKGTGWTISGGTANCDGTNFATISQSKILVVGKTYKYSFTISNLTQGGVRLFLGNTVGSTNSANGTFTGYITYSSGSSIFLQARDSFIGSITNISVKEVGQDWTLGTGWSIGENKALYNGVSEPYLYSLSPVNIAVSDKLKITFVLDSNAKLRFVNENGSRFSGTWVLYASGTHEVYLTSSIVATQIGVQADTDNGAFGITNISVIEITDDTNLPRINYEGFSYDANGDIIPNSGCGNWLLEPQSTNLITQSELFSDSAWTKKVNASITSNVVISPNGTLNSDTITLTTSGGTTQLYQVKNITGTSQSLSIFIKYISGSGTNFLFSIGSAVEKGINLTFTNNGAALTGVAGVDVTSYKIEDYENNWFRVSFTANYANSNCEFNLYRPLGTGTDVYAIYGAQLESSTSYPTSYIPTQGASSTTRLQDIATNSGNASLINSEEGTLYFEGSALADDGSLRTITLGDGSSSNAVSFRYDNPNQITLYVNSGGVSQCSFAVNVTTLSYNKIALKYKENDFSAWANGVQLGTDTIGSTFSANTLNRINFNIGYGPDSFYGKTKALAVYKTALTDANLRSLTYPPAVATTFDLNFNTIADDFTFTRGSEATFVNAQGLIQSTASNDAPRLDYSTGAEAFLLEPQSTNLVTYSSDFSQIENYNSTITINNNVSPDGNINGNLWLANATASAKELQELYTVTNGTTYTESWFVKYKSQQFIQLVTTSATFGAFYGNFDLINGTKESGSFTDFSIEPYLNGWYRISATQVATSSGSGRLAGLRMIESATAPRGGNITTTGTEAVEVWGHQSEALSYQTSYIPTSGASATRNQELCNNATPVINSEEGTLYAEISALADDQTNRIISLSDGTGNNQVLILYQLDSNILRVGFQVANQTDIVIDVNTNTTLISKIAVNYNSTSVKLYLNGSKVGETSTGYTFSSNVLDNLSFSYGSGILPFFGNTKDLKYYPKALADVQLQDLTTI